MVRVFLKHADFFLDSFFGFSPRRLKDSKEHKESFKKKSFTARPQNHFPNSLLR
jgi:hypothetical protein